MGDTAKTVAEMVGDLPKCSQGDCGKDVTMICLLPHSGEMGAAFGYCHDHVVNVLLAYQYLMGQEMEVTGTVVSLDACVEVDEGDLPGFAMN